MNAVKGWAQSANLVLFGASLSRYYGRGISLHPTRAPVLGLHGAFHFYFGPTILEYHNTVLKYLIMRMHMRVRHTSLLPLEYKTAYLVSRHPHP